MEKNYYLGLDIGGTKCAVLAGTARMQILDRVEFPTRTDKGPGYALAKLLETSGNLIKKNSDRHLVSVGISCGGPLDSRAGIVHSPPNLPGWDNIEIVRTFREKFNVPVYLQNDANACALAEWRFGAGKGTRNMVFLTFGTGMGAGLILDGRIYTGTNDLAGEVGHIRLDEDGPEGFGKRGSFEGFCSGGSIPQLAGMVIKEKLQKDEKVSPRLQKKDPENLTTKDLAIAASEGDPTAIEIFGLSGRYLGKGLSILIDILNPQRIVIGSVYARNPHLFDPDCTEIIKKEAISAAREVCEIVPAALGDKVGDYACLTVAIEM